MRTKETRSFHSEKNNVRKNHTTNDLSCYFSTIVVFFSTFCWEILSRICVLCDVYGHLLSFDGYDFFGSSWLSGAQQNSFISSTTVNRSLFGLLIRWTHEGRSSSFVHHHTAGNLLFPQKTSPSCIIHYYIQTGTPLPPPSKLFLSL